MINDDWWMNDVAWYSLTKKRCDCLLICYWMSELIRIERRVDNELIAKNEEMGITASTINKQVITCYYII